MPTNPPSPSPAPAAHSFSAASLTLEAAAFLALLLGLAYLFATNSAGAHWMQGYNPAGFWQLSTLIAALPVVVLLGAMAILRLKAHIAAIAGLVTALVAAIAIFHMPARLAFTAAAYGAGYGLFPICWIILPVIFLYDLTVQTGRFVTLQQSLTGITADSRLQLLLIAFALGSFFEGTSGFGTPVAVCASILISLGFRPLQAAGLCLLANTAPVAFGAMGIPVIALHGVTGLDLFALTRTTAVILLPFDLLVPFWLIWVFGGFTAMIEVWPAILVAGVTFASAQLLIAFWNGPWLVAIAAAAATIVVLVVFLRFWQPQRTLNVNREDITGQSHQAHGHTASTIFKAWLPWLVLSVVVFAWGLPRFSTWMDAKTTVKIPVAGLHNVVLRVPPVVAAPTPEPAVFNLNWLSATGTGILFATIAAMMALGYITRYCGLDATLGLAFARTGPLYPFFGTLIGWLGTASTGSDTSSNVLFGSLQTMTARQIGVAPILMASANAAGGVMGKMIAAPSVVVASTATQTYGQEGSILRFVFLHSLALAALAGICVSLLAYVPLLAALVAH
jgi:lactate permease